MTQFDNQAIEIIPTLLVGDSAFDTEMIALCTLCIEVDERRIRFCIIKEENMECIWLEDYNFEKALSQEDLFEKLKRIFTGHLLWSSHHWKNVRITINSHPFCLIPRAVFDKESVNSYLEFALGHPVPANHRVLYHELLVVNAYNVFSIPNLWYDWMLNHFQNSSITFYHLTSPLIIGSLVSHAEYEEVRIASVFFEKDYFTLIITEGTQLILCNRFQFSQPQEIVYIILFTLNQVNIHQEEVSVLVYGEISMASNLFEELSRFFPNLKLGSRPSTLKYNTQCSEIPGHRYFGLFNTYLVSS